jgi:hypothetical protein
MLLTATKLLLDSIKTNTPVAFSYTNDIMLKLISLGAVGFHSNGTTYDINIDGIRVSYDDCSQMWFVSCECSSASYFDQGGSNFLEEDNNRELARRWAEKSKLCIEVMEYKLAAAETKVKELSPEPVVYTEDLYF